MINKVKELRQQVPIPMNEALQLLKENEGDVEQCVYLYKAKSIACIREQTGCDEAMANKFYEAEKLDINRSISFIRDEIYDQNYQPIDGVTKDTIRAALQWVKLVQSKELGYSLDFNQFATVVRTMSAIPELQSVAVLLDKAKKAKEPIFAGYSDDLPIEEFVRRSQRLDDHPDFQDALNSIPLRLTIINEELLKHLRNLPETFSETE